MRVSGSCRHVSRLSGFERSLGMSEMCAHTRVAHKRRHVTTSKEGLALINNNPGELSRHFVGVDET